MKLAAGSISASSQTFFAFFIIAFFGVSRNLFPFFDENKEIRCVNFSEERTRPSRAAAVASERANKAIMSVSVQRTAFRFIIPMVQAGIAPNVSKETLFALHTPTSSRPQRSARANLIDRFMATPSGASSSSNSPNKRSRKAPEGSEEPERKRTRTSQPSSSPPGSVSPKGGIPGLGKEQISQ